MDSENFPKKLSRSARRRRARKLQKLGRVPQTTAEGLARSAGELAAAADVVHVLHQAPFTERSIYDQEQPAGDEEAE